MDNGIFSEKDREILRNTHDGVIKLLEWREGHDKADDKFQEIVTIRLNDHAKSIGKLKEWRWYITGMIIAIGGIITLIVEFKR